MTGSLPPARTTDFRLREQRDIAAARKLLAAAFSMW